MKEKFKKELIQKTKDLGLSAKAIDDLVALGINGLADDASDEDITEKVDSLIPFAKAMQGEVTRKTQKSSSRKPAKKSAQDDDEDDDDDDGNDEDRIPKWARAMQESLDGLRKENEALKAEKATSERKAAIAAKARELGIPDVHMKRFAIADDEDIEKVLTEYKQELVNASLMPKGQVHEIGKATEEEMEKAEEAFVNSLPSRGGSN